MNRTNCLTARRSVERQTLGAAISLILALGLAGCGVGAAADSGGQAPVTAGSTTTAAQALAISTASLPAGQPGQAFPTTTLSATPSAGPVTWTLADGALPQGLTLSADGRISGTPLAAGVSTFTACATRAGLSATRTFAVAIASFGLVALDGLADGTAATDTPVALTCVGASGDVRFEVVQNGSGGLLGERDAAGGTATWRTGALGGGATDRLRAVDALTGAAAELAFEVQRDPTAGFVAEFGTTDVWYVDTTRKHGTHPFASDFQAMLAAAGLRLPSSISREGTAPDRLAESCARLAALRHLSRYFLRGADGSRAQGLPISFPWAEPVGWQRPADGSSLAGAANRFSVISVVHGSNPGILGTAFSDGAQNGNHENDTTASGAGELGVFGNRFVETLNLAYNNLTLLQAPLTADDAEALSAIFYGLSTTHPRAALLRNAIEGVGRSLASVAAHEVGHSLGLAHTSPYVAGSIMNSSAVFGPDVPQFFTAEDVARLRGALPGPGRQGSANAKQSLVAAALTLPEGGVSVCGVGERCNLTLAPAQSEHVPTGCTCGHAHPAR